MFRFRLARVLRYRSRLVDQQARRFRLATEAWSRLRQEKQRLVAEVAATVRRAERHRDQGQRVPLWILQADYLIALRDKMSRIQERENEAAAEMEHQRELLLEARRQKEILEKLAERQREKWEQEQRLRERKEMDEVASARAGAGGKSGLR
jgi:flagellar export protein FliJ